jgi:hypothetical protein
MLVFSHDDLNPLTVYKATLMICLRCTLVLTCFLSLPRISDLLCFILGFLELVKQPKGWGEVGNTQ